VSQADTHLEIFYVTHIVDFARQCYLTKTDTTLCLRAERLSDNRRTFQILEGEPLATSHGKDLYKRIFGLAKQSEIVTDPSKCHNVNG
jgi:hypothetical protein